MSPVNFREAEDASILFEAEGQAKKRIDHWFRDMMLDLSRAILFLMCSIRLWRTASEPRYEHLKVVFLDKSLDLRLVDPLGDLYKFTGAL